MKMRKIIAVLAAVLMLCAIIPMGAASVSAAEIVPNGDFENGTKTGWVDGSSTSSVVSAADLPVANPNGGNYALQTVDTYYGYTNYNISLEKNKDYLLTFSVLSGTKGYPLNVRGRLSNSDLFKNEITPSTSKWETYSIVFNSANNSSIGLRFQHGWETSTFYLDNISVVPYDASALGSSDGFLNNGDFETGDARAWGSTANTTVVADPTGAGHGYVMSTNESESGVTMFSQTARNLKTNTYYKLSFQMYSTASSSANAAIWVRFPSTVTDWSVDVGATGLSHQSANNYTPRINIGSKVGVWHSVSITFNTGDLTEAFINFMNYRANAGQYYFDNIKLREMKAPSFDGYITNGDFETGNLTGWTIGAGNIAEENGNAILQGTATKKYGNFVHQIVDVEANTEYAISFRVKGAVSGGIARVYVGTGTGNTGYVNSTYSWNVSNTAWTNVTVSFNSGANTQLYVNLCQGKDNGGDIYYDDVLMWEVQDPSYDGYLYNGDFEIGVKGAWSTSGSTVIDTASKHDGNFGAHLSVSSASWGGMLNQTLTGLEPGATYSITFWYKVIQQGVNWKVEGETIGDNGKAVSLVSNYVTAKEWTQVSKEFVADGTTARINFSGSGITESKSTYENGIDEMYVDSVVIALVKPAHTCNVVEQERVEADCENDGYIKYACDCGLGEYTETILAKGHTAGEAADCENDQTCTVCGAVLVEALGHDTEVVYVEPTCGDAGISGSSCTRCDWDDLQEVPATGAHTYDHAYDVNCNVCGIIRDVVNPSVAAGTSASEDVNGVAALFDVNVSGLGIAEGTTNVADYTNATMGEYKLISMGVIASNGTSQVEIPCVYLWSLADGSASFAARVINIPEHGYDTEITFQSYFVVEIDGVETTIHGDVATGSYNAVIG